MLIGLTWTHFRSNPMPKLIPRIVACLLVPCLSADPLMASTSLIPPGMIHLAQNSVIETEALGTALTHFGRPNTPTARATSQEYLQESHLQSMSDPDSVGFVIGGVNSNETIDQLTELTGI